jgi:hypothetical protein
MKKILMLLLVATMFTTVGCKKEQRGDSSKQQGELVIQPVTLDLEKSNNFDKDGDYDCETEINYALVYVDGDMYRMPVFYLNGMLYTQSLKLDAGNHILGEFVLMHDNGTPNDYSDDVAIKAAVHSGADYAEFVDFHVDYEFAIEAFVKKEVHVEVLCVDLDTYDEFGFVFFSVWETTLYSKYFFGDLCNPCLDDLEGSLYENQTGGVLLDNSAIFEIRQYRNDVFVTSVNNEDVYGEGVVCMPYADRIGVEDNFRFELWVYVPVGNSYEYVHMYDYIFMDDDMLMENAENVNTFVVGNCLYDSEGVLVLSQYINLPATADFSLGAVHSPAAINVDYKFDLTYTGIPLGYSLENTTYGAYCGEQSVTISLNTTYTANITSSLNLAHASLISGLSEVEVMKLHWVANNLVQDWALIQNVVWSITDGYVLTSIDELAYELLLNAGHLDYNPLPNQDEKVMVILETSDTVQMQVMDLDVCPN